MHEHDYDDDDKKKLERLYIDMYFGKGKDDPPITTRMAMVEQVQNTIAKNLNKAIWVTISTGLLVIAEAIMKITK